MKEWVSYRYANEPNLERYLCTFVPLHSYDFNGNSLSDHFLQQMDGLRFQNVSLSLHMIQLPSLQGIEHNVHQMT